MSNDLNHCALIGRLGKDVESRSLPSGDAVASFSLAVGSSWKDRQTGEKKESVSWVNIVAFKGLAEICIRYLKKGSRVCITGSIRVRKWQDREGKDRYSTEVVADFMEMLDAKREDSGEHEAEHEPAAAPAAAERGALEDDDIPF